MQSPHRPRRRALNLASESSAHVLLSRCALVEAHRAVGDRAREEAELALVDALAAQGEHEYFIQCAVARIRRAYDPPDRRR